MLPKFIPYLFDNYDAWVKTINDKRYSYEMSFNEFMNIYIYYRNNKIELEKYKKPIETSIGNECLTQDIIDQLFNSK